ncbi:MAG: DsbC family protein [Nitrospirae bacterium]|nr:DsbC family protein [Nitrospirota bacterium]
MNIFYTIIYMRLIIICLSIVLAIIFKLGVSDGLSFGESGCSSDCAQCHSLTVQEVDKLIKKVTSSQSSIRVIDVKLSRVKSLWEVSIEEKGLRGLIYIDFSKKHLIPGPLSFIELDSANSKTNIEKPLDRRVDAQKIFAGNALILGKPRAAKKVAVFTDPDCPFCGSLHKELKKIVNQRSDIVFYLKLFPLKMHRDAYWKSKSIMCSGSLKLLEDVYDKKNIEKKDCPTKEIDENISLAESFGINSTPTLVLSDGTVVTGYMPSEKLIQLIDGNK